MNIKSAQRIGIDCVSAEIATILQPNGQILLVEPPFHVSKLTFEETIKQTRDAGFLDTEGPHMIFHKTAILRRG